MSETEWTVSAYRRLRRIVLWASGRAQNECAATRRSLRPLQSRVARTRRFNLRDTGRSSTMGFFL